MATWFTADLHIGHENIIYYCQRPYESVEEMTSALIHNWNSVIDANDTVWVLGDVAMGRIDATLPTVGALAGNKILVAGNHDRCWFGHGDRSTEWVQRYRDAGFVEIVQGQTEITVGDHEVTVCHFPYSGDSHGEERYSEHRPVDDGGWLIHGHVHQEWVQHGRQINVGVDVHGLHPVTESTIVNLIEAGERTFGGLVELY